MDFLLIDQLMITHNTLLISIAWKNLMSMRKKNFAPTIYPLSRDLQKAWFVRYRDENGKLYKVYGKLAHYNNLEDKLKEAKRIIKGILHPVKTKENTRKNLIYYLSECLENDKYKFRIKTYQCYLSQLKKFAEWYNVEIKKDKQLSADKFIAYLYECSYSQNYIRKFRFLLHKYFNTLVHKKVCAENPFVEIKIRKIKGKSKLPFSLQQKQQLLTYIEVKDKQLRDVVDFLYYLFFRPNEIRQLKIEDILFDEMKIIVNNEIAKDNDNYMKTIPVPMQQHILKYKNYPPEFYIFSTDFKPGAKMLGMNYLTAKMTTILRALNYSSRYTLYSWVHTGIKDAALSGIPIKQLQLQKGHHDLNMFNEYMKDLGVDDCVQLTNNFPKL